jgi:thioredoxin reductase/ferredoxin
MLVNVEMSQILVWGVYLLALALAVLYVRRLRQRSARAQRALAASRDGGSVEPASLHPLIDQARCIGCGACVTACPEGDVLGLIERRASLVKPDHCIGHGACSKACPMGAIDLVFGTEKRGVDIPFVSASFETNVPGIYIAGELGGMGLIRNAIEQGRQAMESIAKSVNKGGPQRDVAVIGAGPAGFAASLGAMQAGLDYLTLEQGSLGGTVFHFPRGKIVMTAPVKLPVAGKVKPGDTSKEALLRLWQDVENKSGLEIHYHERLEKVSGHDGNFVLKTSKGEHQVKKILLAIGRRGTPRTLDVPGEDLPKVVYRLIDAEQYVGQNVLVVGGGDSALEAALSIAEQEGTTVTIAYRSQSFSRAKEKNRHRIEQAQASKAIAVLFETNVSEILHDRVKLAAVEEEIIIRNDAVIICAGGVLPTAFLKNLGIEVETKHGTA